MKKTLRDVAVRAAKTFVQAFLAVVATAQFTNVTELRTVLTAAVAAGVSATWNLIIAANSARKA